MSKMINFMGAVSGTQGRKMARLMRIKDVIGSMMENIYGKQCQMLAVGAQSRKCYTHRI
jgi:hypothetical protein